MKIIKLKWHNEKRKVSDLIPFEKNPRKITEKQKDDLKASLEKFDLVEIPAINTDNKIIAGHQRVMTLHLLGRGKEKIDVRVPNRKLNKKEFEEYNIRSNKNVADWDWDILEEIGADMLKEIGFEDEELEKILSTDIDEKDDEIPKISKKAKSKLGDIYQLGDHRIMCADSTDKKSVKDIMNGKKARLLFTSPPYNMGGKMYENYEDNLKSEEYINFNIKVVNEWKKYLFGFLFWNISYNKKSRWEFIEIMHKIITETGLKFLELIVWNKKHALPIMSKEMMTRQFEDILVAGNDEEAGLDQDIEMGGLLRNDKKAYFNRKTKKWLSNYWEINVNKVQLEENQACYPVELPVRAILIMSGIKDIITDPFIGSGSTLIACEKTDRICYGMEIDPLYIDIIIKRWEKYTNKKAKLIK